MAGLYGWALFPSTLESRSMESKHVLKCNGWVVQQQTLFTRSSKKMNEMNEDQLIFICQSWQMQIEYLKMCINYNQAMYSIDYSLYSALEYAEYNFNENMNVLLQVISPDILHAAQNLVKIRLGFV